VSYGFGSFLLVEWFLVGLLEKRRDAFEEQEIAKVIGAKWDGLR
jgi:hypothetical protein